MSLKAKEAWVVFSGQSELKMVRPLKSGFKHCFVLLHDEDEQRWIGIDPMANYMDVRMYDQFIKESDLITWLKEQGCRVIKAKITRNIMHPAPVMLFTCVEACKRILGIHKFWVFTPWQLYRHLKAKE